MSDNNHKPSFKKNIIHASCGTAIIFTWYACDHLLYDASVGTVFQRIFDVLAFVLFLPFDAAWHVMYQTGILPLRDYTHEFILYYATGGIYLVCLGSWLGLFTAALIRRIRKP